MKALVAIDGLIIDNFAGGGGASTGIEAAVGRSVDVAINHDPEAVALHKANHPGTRHFCQSVWRADPLDVTEGQQVGLVWFSPDCKHFSKAKGGKPVEKHIRDLAWVVVHWAKRVKPRVLMLENVEEFQTWGPLGEDGRPDPAQKGKIFKLWVRQLRRLGYRVQWRELRACDYGAPTSRKRLFLIARCDGLPIVWPKPTHGKPGSPAVLSGKLLPWRTAASIIDWSIPCPSIFERPKPLADATCRRIAAGIKRYVLDAAKPFIVPLTHHGSAERLYDVDAPVPTVTAAHRGEMAFVQPFVSYAQQGGANRPADEPHHTITASPKDQNCVVAPVIVGCGGRRGQSGPVDPTGPYPTTTAKADACLVAATMVQQGYGEREGQAPRALDLGKPVGTVVAGGGKHGVVAAFLEKFSQNSRGKSAEDPIDTVMAGAPRHAVIAAHMAQFNTNPGGRENPGHPVDDPVSTIATRGPHQGVVASSIVKLRGTSKDGQPSDEPLQTISAGGLHHAVSEATIERVTDMGGAVFERASAEDMARIHAFMIKYYGNEDGGHGLDKPIGTVTTKERFGVVTVDIDGEPYAIVDIGMRMLSPRELFAAQGFPASYVIDPIVDGKPLTKTAQIRMCGNSVCPPMSEALVRANFASASEEREAA